MDIDVEDLEVRTALMAPACVVVTVLVMSPGWIKLPIVGETGGEIRFNTGGPTQFVNTIES